MTIGPGDFDFGHVAFVSEAEMSLCGVLRHEGVAGDDDGTLGLGGGFEIHDGAVGGDAGGAFEGDRNPVAGGGLGQGVF